MSSVIEHIKSRLAEAHHKLTEAAAVLQKAQNEHQNSQREFMTWRHALQIEEQRILDSQKPSDTQIVKQFPTQHAALVHAANEIIESAGHADKIENKTEYVRELLSKSSHGMTPAEVWEVLKGQMDRTYLYSVLKRLKDKKQVSVRRGKYYFNPVSKSEESKEAMVLQ